MPRRTPGDRSRPAVGRPALLRREVLPAAPVQSRSRENRRRIRTAALECFRQQGYNATSIDAIATRAGVAVGGVYLHYKSKRQLLLYLMDELIESLASIQLTAVDGHPRTVIRVLLQRAFDRDLEFLGVYRAWQEAVLSDEELAAHDMAIRRWTQQRLTGLFTALQQLPGARRDVEVKTLGAVMDRFFWTLLADALRTDLAELTRWIDVASDVTYHALFHDEPRRSR